MKSKIFGTQNQTAMKNTKIRNFESLESRRLLTIFQAGDANLDFYFDEADIIQVFKNGKFESEQAATWADGDWDGMFSPTAMRTMLSSGSYDPFATPEGNGRFDSDDLEQAFESGKFKSGTYLIYTSKQPVHSRESLSTDPDADISVIYDGANGDVSIEGSDTIFSTFHLNSDAGIFRGIDASADLGGFEVAGRSGDLANFFLLEPSGTTSVKYESLAIPGLTIDELVSDLTVDGSLLEGGGLGRVSISCVNCEVKVPLHGDVNADLQLSIEDIDALSQQIFDGTYDAKFDLNDDQSVDLDDLQILVQDILKTNFGDANLDGKVDTADLISVFLAGQYEDGISFNSTWSTGDWNADREFDSLDLIVVLLNQPN